MKHILPSLALALALSFISQGRGEEPFQPAARSRPTYLRNVVFNQTAEGQGADAAADRAAVNLVDGQQLVADAARRVHAESSVKANVRFRVNAFSHEVTGVGTYLQLGQGPEKLLRLELKAQVGDRPAIIQEICSEDDYWVRRDVPPLGTFVGRANLRPIRQATAKLERMPAGDPMQAWIALGGLPKLLDGLNQNFQFGPAKASEITFTTADGKGTEKLPVWVVEGEWKADRLAGIAGTAPDAAPQKLPEQIPARVELVLGRIAEAFPLFPYRITYLRAQPDAADKSEEADAARRLASVPLMMLEFYGVYHISELDPREFDYDPGDQEVADLTQTFVQRLGLADVK